jgi:acetyl-CoA carboxylase biotin carboxyl carrier protein
VDLKDIKAIIDLMRKNSLSEFELERQDFKIKLKRGISGAVVPVEEPMAASYAVPPAAPAAGLPAAASSPEPSPASSLQEIKSPMIGTFTAPLRRSRRIMWKSAPKFLPKRSFA